MKYWASKRRCKRW